ncbi:glycosyl hydrolase family 61-domain-containing protein [Cytidiella melzeri]|nr:glycosyl hydrolase family 61-domain-containing protein [Cytidiella melzeri]
MIASTALFISTVLLSTFTSGVAAHGYLASVTIGGKSYTAWDPNVDPYASPIPSRVTRVVPNDGPVIDLSDASLACNVGGNKGAALVVDAAAGSQVTFTMNRWPDDHKGPISHYMAACTNGDCKTFDTADASWFKVDAAGLSGGVWASDLLIQNGLSDTMTIPAELKPGQYLIRHELIALHSSPAQIQVYPECVQVRVTGSGSTSPSGSSLVKIPGVYATTTWPDIWADGFKSFNIPGPAPAFGGSGGTNNAAPAPPTASSLASSSPLSPSSSPSAASASLATPSSLPTPSKSSSSLQASATGQCRGRMARRSQRHAAMSAKRHH